MALSKRVRERIAAKTKHFRPILADARNRDVSESDTVLIITEMLSEMLGYRKFQDITTEFAVRATYVDLAVRKDTQTLFLVEAKAIGTDLKDQHVRQAVDYAANNGVEWVVLTNAARWQLYRVVFKQPIERTLAFDVDLLDDACKPDDLIECIGALAREEFTPTEINEFYNERQAISRYTVAAALQRDGVLNALRRELRLIAPRVKLSDEELRVLVREKVLKREVVDSESAAAAMATLTKAGKAAQRAKMRAADRGGQGDIPPTADAAVGAQALATAAAPPVASPAQPPSPVTVAATAPTLAAKPIL